MTLDPTSAPNDAYTVIVVTRDHGGTKEFLMVRHEERGWELPGGKLDDKEGPVHCALREFREETGHLLAEPKFVLKKEKDNGTCYVFKGRLGTKVQDRPDGEAVRDMQWRANLPPEDELAFPDDPYDEIGEAMGVRFHAHPNG